MYSSYTFFLHLSHHTYHSRLFHLSDYTHLSMLHHFFKLPTSSTFSTSSIFSTNPTNHTPPSHLRPWTFMALLLRLSWPPVLAAALPRAPPSSWIIWAQGASGGWREISLVSVITCELFV